MAVERGLARRIARIQNQHNGAIAGAQLRELGVTRSAIRARVSSGRLVQIFRDIYSAGDPRLMPLVRPSGALLALGVDAVISHRCAAAVWGLADPDPFIIDVTVPRDRHRPRKGIRLHHVKHLHPADITTRSKLRVTTLARTLIDFASQATSSERHRAFGEARAKHRLSDRDLHAALGRVPANHPGAAIVRQMLGQGDTYDRSKAERIMRKLCRQGQLPEPSTNTHRNGYLVDFLWPDAHLILEIDGATHLTRTAFENDRRRDQTHAANGYTVIRITWHQLQHEPLAILTRLAQALAHRGPAA
jgi:very-short-patch-repair endonuclease